MATIAQEPAKGEPGTRPMKKAVPRLQALMQELGDSGLNRWGGVINEEFLRVLQGTAGVRIYREMRDNDSVIGGFLATIDLLIRNLGYPVEPADGSQEAARAAELVQTSLDTMSHTWEATLSEILSFLVYGWSWMEIVYRKREDGLIGWRKFALRGQSTLVRWEFDDAGGVKAMVQQTANNAAQVSIPIEKSLLFRTRIEKQSPEGRSLLRNAYLPWFYKRRVMEVWGIGMERDLAGVPVLISPDGMDIFNKQDPEMVTLKASAQKIVRSLKRDQHEGILIPFGWELKLLGTAGRRQFDLPAAINLLNRQIATSAISDVLLMGQDKVGSFALARTKDELFRESISSYAEIIASVLNRHAIPRLMEINAIPKELSPSIVPGSVENVSLKEVSEYASNLAGAGLLTPDEELEAHYRGLGGLPLAADSETRGAGKPQEEE